MNPKRQFRRLRDDDRWAGLPPTMASAARSSAIGHSRVRRSYLATGAAFLIAGLVAVVLWAVLSGLHEAEQPASPEPLPFSTSRPSVIGVPCTDAARLAPIGCATYATVAASGVSGGTASWAGATAATFTLRVLEGRVTALVASGCNELTIPMELSDRELNPTGGVAMTLRLCTGASSNQEKWITSFFRGPVRYTIEGTELRLTSGQRALVLTATPAAMASPTPTSSAPIPSGAPSEAAHATKTTGCAPTTALTPRDALTARITDVDDDGRPDTEWARLAEGALQFGITTASGATISGSQGFAGGGTRSFVVGKLANGVVVAITSEGRDSPVYTFSSCAFHPVTGKSLIDGAKATAPFMFYSETDGGDGGCYHGRLALVHLAAIPGDPTSGKMNAIARWIDVSPDGRHATITNETATIATNLDIDTDPERYLRYSGISCGTTKVLQPTVRAR